MTKDGTPESQTVTSETTTEQSGQEGVALEGERNFIDDQEEEPEAEETDTEDSSYECHAPKEERHAPTFTSITWDRLFNPANFDIRVDYLLDKHEPWSEQKMHMRFLLPDIIGFERKASSELSKVEQAQIAREVAVHLRKVKAISPESITPEMWFRGAELTVNCSDFKMTSALWYRPPVYLGLQMDVVSKAFGASNTEAHVFRWVEHRLAILI